VLRLDSGTDLSSELKFYGSLSIDELTDTTRHTELLRSDRVYFIIEPGYKSTVIQKIPGAVVIEFK